MKCPNCKFVSSNKRDVCPKCRTDLRPQKSALGIPIVNSRASVDELISEYESAAAKTAAAAPASNPLKKKKKKRKKNTISEKEGAPQTNGVKSKKDNKSQSWLSKLVGGNSKTESSAQEPPTEPQTPAPKVTETPEVEQIQQQASLAPSPTNKSNDSIASASEEILQGDQDELLALFESFDKAVEKTAQTLTDMQTQDPESRAPKELDLDFDMKEIVNTDSDDDDEDLFAELKQSFEADDTIGENLLSSSELEQLISFAENPEAAQGIEAAEAKAPEPKIEAPTAITSEAPLSEAIAENYQDFDPNDSSMSLEALAAAELLQSIDSGEQAGFGLDQLTSRLEDDEPDLSESMELLDHLSNSMDSSIKATVDATRAIGELEFGGTTKPETRLQSSPSVRPDIVEFGDDDQLLEAQLDEMLEDLVLGVEAVAPDSKQKSVINKPEPSDSFIIDDDIEVSIEIEIEEEVETTPTQKAKTPSIAVSEPSDEQVESELSGLLNAFDQITGNTTEISLTPQVEEHSSIPQGDALLGQLSESLAEETVRQDTPAPTNIEAESEMQGIVGELTQLVAEAYGIDPDNVLAQLGISAKSKALMPSSEEIDPLKSLEDELDRELMQLSSEGTSFYQEDESEVDEVAVLEGEEEVDPLQALQDELAAELEALKEEGTTLFTAEQSPNESSTEAAEQGLISELDSLIEDPQLEDDEPVVEVLETNLANEEEELLDALEALSEPVEEDITSETVELTEVNFQLIEAPQVEAGEATAELSEAELATEEELLEALEALSEPIEENITAEGIEQPFQEISLLDEDKLASMRVDFILVEAQFDRFNEAKTKEPVEEPDPEASESSLYSLATLRRELPLIEAQFARHQEEKLATESQEALVEKLCPSVEDHALPEIPFVDTFLARHFDPALEAAVETLEPDSTDPDYVVQEGESSIDYSLPEIGFTELFLARSFEPVLDTTKEIAHELLDSEKLEEVPELPESLSNSGIQEALFEEIPAHASAIMDDGSFGDLEEELIADSNQVELNFDASLATEIEQPAPPVENELSDAENELRKELDAVMADPAPERGTDPDHIDTPKFVPQVNLTEDFYNILKSQGGAAETTEREHTSKNQPVGEAVLSESTPVLDSSESMSEQERLARAELDALMSDTSIFDIDELAVELAVQQIVAEAPPTDKSLEEPVIPEEDPTELLEELWNDPALSSSPEVVELEQGPGGLADIKNELADLEEALQEMEGLEQPASQQDTLPEDVVNATGLFLASDMERIISSISEGTQDDSPEETEDSSESYKNFLSLDSEIECLVEEALQVVSSHNETELPNPEVCARAAETQGTAPVARLSEAELATLTAPLWTSADNELRWESIEGAGAEFTISNEDLYSLQRSEVLDVLFDAAQKELKLEPEGKQIVDMNNLQTSADKTIDDSALQRAFDNFAKEAKALKEHKEQKTIEQIKQRRESKNKPEVIGINTAPRWRRLFAAIVDALSYLVVGFLAAAVMHYPEELQKKLMVLEVPSIHEFLPVLFPTLGYVLVAWVMMVAMLSWTRGQTVGQRMWDIQVVRMNNKEVDFAQAFLFGLSQVATLGTLGLGNLLILGKKKRAMHDRIAKVWIARVNPEQTLYVGTSDY